MAFPTAFRVIMLSGLRSAYIVSTIGLQVVYAYWALHDMEVEWRPILAEPFRGRQRDRSSSMPFLLCFKAPPMASYISGQKPDTGEHILESPC
jgi:hypothetical protein